MLYLQMVIDSVNEEKVQQFLDDMVAEAAIRGLSVQTCGVNRELDIKEKLEVIKTDIDWVLDDLENKKKLYLEDFRRQALVNDVQNQERPRD